jgi:NTE family protein
MAASSPHVASTITAPEHHGATDLTRPRSPRRAAAHHRPFALVLAGGGARLAAHIGVLRALEHEGYRPSAIVGVRARLRAMLRSGRALRHLVLRWGALTYAREPIEARLRGLTLDKRIEEARLPLAIVATDLLSGRRVILTTGSAAEAAYASSALAGILPPARYGSALLADGCYADVAPVDVARGLGYETVLAVNPSPRGQHKVPRTGHQALMRAMEISHHRHALARIRQADLEIAPSFASPIDILDFGRLRVAIAAGARAVRTKRRALTGLLRAAEPTQPPAADVIDIKQPDRPGRVGA